ncbi:MAG: GIY-YIG nuclease family protein [Chthoniobacterales bacterium]
MHDCFVYILTNKSRDVFYGGVTNDLQRRLAEHGEEHIGFAGRYNLRLLVHVEQFSDASAAIAREKQLKGWRRSKKIALITRANPHWDDLAEGF